MTGTKRNKNENSFFTAHLLHKIEPAPSSMQRLKTPVSVPIKKMAFTMPGTPLF